MGGSFTHLFWTLFRDAADRFMMTHAFLVLPSAGGDLFFGSCLGNKTRTASYHQKFQIKSNKSFLVFSHIVNIATQTDVSSVL